MSEYFSKLQFLAKIEVDLGLVNYATEADLQNETGVDTSDFAKNADLKSNAGKLDIQKLKNVLIGLIKLKSKVNKLKNW